MEHSITLIDDKENLNLEKSKFVLTQMQDRIIIDTEEQTHKHSSYI